MKTASNKKKMFLFLGLISAVGIFVLTAPAQAGFEWAAELLGGIIGWVISALGIILVLIIKALVFVAQYNNFINSQAVENGWRIVRDVANMFFVVVLLIISFATILNQEKYSYKTWLPKVILMAVLINFSKTICGILIDVAQVAMLTFVNAFKGMAAGNLVSNLGILEIVTIANDSGDIGFWAIIGSYFLGLLYMIVTIVTIVTMLAMLVMRMVMIWIYVVLSPAAYLFAAFPGGQKYSSMWWTEFSKNLIVGPVLAFFIWLSFVSMQSYDVAKDFGNTPGVVTTEGAGKELAMEPDSAYGSSRGGTQANELDVFLKFIISIGMLIGGLKIASEIGGAAGKIAGSGMAKLQQGASWAGKSAWKGAVGAEKWGARKLAKKTGVDLRLSTLKAGWKAHSESSKRKDEAEIGQKSREHFEAGGLRSITLGAGAGEDYFNRYAEGFLGIKGIVRAGKEVAVSPFKRRELGAELDSTEANISQLKVEKEKAQAKHDENINDSFEFVKSKDGSLNSLNSEKEANSVRIEELKSKDDLTKDEEKELKSLESKNTKIDANIKEREKVLKTNVENDYYDKVGTSNGGESMDEIIQRSVDEVNKKFAEALKNVDPTGEVAKLESKKARGIITPDEEIKLTSLKNKQAKVEEDRKHEVLDAENNARTDYINRTSGAYNLDNEIKKNEDIQKNLKKQIMGYQKPVALEGRASYRKNIEEAKSKYKGITNSDELVKAFTDAKQRGDKFDQTAILEKLSSDGNLNDVLNNQGYKSDAEGLYQFVYGHKNEKGGGDPLTGFSNNERLNILNDLGESEERVNHWEMAKMAGVNSKGEMESLVRPIKDTNGNVTGYDTSRHTAAAFNETQKMDPQQAVIRLNRLAYGGEDADGNFHIADLGKLIFKSLAEGGAYQKHSSRIQANAAANLVSPGTLPVLKQILNQDKKMAKEVVDALKSRGETADGTSSQTSSMMNWLQNFNQTQKDKETI